MDAGQTKSDPSGWSTDTLHTHLQSLLNDRDRLWMELRKADQAISEQRFTAQRELTLQAMESAQRAITKAEAAVEKRLENTNEWRAAMNDRDLKLLPRMEFDAILKEWASWREGLLKEMATWRGGAEKRITVIETRSVTWTASLGIFFIILQLLFRWFLKP